MTATPPDAAYGMHQLAVCAMKCQTYLRHHSRGDEQAREHQSCHDEEHGSPAEPFADIAADGTSQTMPVSRQIIISSMWRGMPLSGVRRIITTGYVYFFISKIPSTSCSTNGPSLHSRRTLGSRHSSPCQTFLGMSTP